MDNQSSISLAYFHQSIALQHPKPQQPANALTEHFLSRTNLSKTLGQITSSTPNFLQTPKQILKSQLNQLILT